MKIVISANSLWNIYNFRKDLVNQLIDKNHKVIIFAPIDKYLSKFEHRNIEIINLKLDRKDYNFFKNLLVIFDFFKLFYQKKPDIYLSYTIKPNIFGTFASFFFKNLKVYNNITGLGTFYFNKNFYYNFISYKFSCSEFSKLHSKLS